jgi:hypothetical protein
LAGHRAGRARRLAAAAATLIACTGGPREPARGLGALLHGGAVRALAPSPDGAALAFLDRCQEVKAQFLPPQTARCDLEVVPTGGGAPAKVAAGVTTLAHGTAWSPDGAALLALADYDHATASGTLVVWRDGAARTLADGVTFHGFGAGGEIGMVARGRLLLAAAPGQLPAPVDGATDVATFDLVPRRRAAAPPAREAALDALARRTPRAGAQLLGVLGTRAVPFAASVAEYAFAPSGGEVAYTTQGEEATLWTAPAALPPRPHAVAARVRQFEYWPGAREEGVPGALAVIRDAAPGKQGDLSVRFEPPPDGGRRAPLTAREVGEFRWARDARRIAWLEAYDPRVRSGTLGAGGDGVAPRTFARNVSDFEISPDGRHVAFLQHTTRGGYSVDLGVARTDGAADEKPATVAQGVFGFAFSPDARWLYYRTRCVRNAEACDLERVPAAGLGTDAKPELIAPGVKSFEFDPRDPERLLLGWQRMDMVALDVGVWRQGTLTRVDTAVLPGSARFLGPDSRRLAYVVVHPKRQGVYVAELTK